MSARKFNGNEKFYVQFTRNELARIMSALSVSEFEYRRTGATDAASDEKELREKIRIMLHV